MDRAATLARRLHAFRGDDRGIALIEFALIVPILLVILLAGAELVNVLENRRKVVQLTRTLADLTSLGDATNPVTATTMNNIFDSSVVVLAPFDTTGVSMKVSAVGVPLIGVTTVAFVCSGAARNATARGRGVTTAIQVPEQYQFNGARWIYVEVSMTYTPIFGSNLAKILPNLNLAFTWNETASWAVRGGAAVPPNTQQEVVLPGGNACP
ncbi:TadE/TadG family type IV pilus assembly protein [Methylobacterium marchantiae]|uniref:TadE/TadG family type IV pilus assembly protein n=1 Tax=Methylobacterium marchantiae TaxID=600331 RepID=A0ABW3X1I0_9HYPH